VKQRYREYEIASLDDSNYTVSRASTATKGKNEGKETLATLGYFSTVEAAVLRVATLCGNDARNLWGWLDEYEAVMEDFEDILKPKEAV
jgi:hypothetical protein